MTTAGNVQRILQVNTADLGGGAERVTMDLHSAYLRRGMDAWVAVGEKHTDDPRVLAIPNEELRGGMTTALASLAGQRPDSAVIRAALIASDPVRYSRILRGREDFDFPATSGILEMPPSPPHVLQLHNLHGYYFDLRMLPWLSSRIPTVITMHDAWLLTGHCAHPFECINWRTGCGSCRDLSMYVPISRDASAQNRAEKFDILKRSRVRLAAPSEWLMRMVHESGTADLVLETRVIPNGVDTAVFSPESRSESRGRLGLPLDRPVLLVAANVLKVNPFKDYATLVAALPILADIAPDTLVVALGAGPDDFPDLRLEVRAAPFVRDRATMADYYRAADVYAHPARAENLPLALIEASSCGTAVVASDVGGVPEVVEDGVTGDLVPSGDAQCLAEKIAALLSDGDRLRRYGEAGRKRVLERFDLERQAVAYLEWFEELVSLPAAPPPQA